MATNREEIEANGFGAALHMPEAMIAIAARDHLSQTLVSGLEGLAEIRHIGARGGVAPV